MSEGTSNRTSARESGRGRAALLTALVLPLVVAGCGLLGGADEVLLLGAAEVGPDPFVGEAGSAPPAELEEAGGALAAAADAAEAGLGLAEGTVGDEASEDAAGNQGGGDEGESGPDPAAVQRVRQAAVIEAAESQGLDVIRPAAPLGVGLYGGTGENVCSIEAMVAFFDTDPEAAAAWAAVQGIDPADIASYLTTLTPGYLLDEHTVINHGYVDGAADPFDAVMAAGTAVLVDGDGIPRVRCQCGNPLAPALVDLGDATVASQDFADAVVDSAISPEIEFPYDDPQQALGAPDYRGYNPSSDIPTEVSLGTASSACQYYLTVEFVDNYLVSGPGDDLRVVEVGEVEPTDVLVGNSVEELVPVGQIGGGDRSIDISGAVPEGERVTMVRLCDVPDTETSAVPGADIDAVAALNSAPR